MNVWNCCKSVLKDGEASPQSQKSHVHLNAVCLGPTVSSSPISSDVQEANSENVVAKNGFQRMLYA